MIHVARPIVKRFTSALQKWLPARTKRLIMVASFSASVKDTEQLDAKTIETLNELMGLSKSSKALGLPVVVSKVIWDNKVVHDISQELHQPSIPETSLATLIQRIKDQVPSWLRYDEPTLDHDLRVMIEHRSEVL